MSMPALEDLMKLFHGWESKWEAFVAENQAMIGKSQDEWDMRVRNEVFLTKHDERSKCENCGKGRFVGPMVLGNVQEPEEKLELDLNT